jgi:hypothetical protein
MVTIFRNIFDKQPYYITVDKALERIRTGASEAQISDIRKQLSKDRADKLKANLPSVCFSGTFTERKDDCLKEHSGFIVLDFDNLDDLREKQTEIISKPFVYACWVSPRGNGLKALVKIASPQKHREHFAALKDIFPEIDESGKNESRVCYESFDPEIYINEAAQVFTKTKKTEKVQASSRLDDNRAIFDKILVWLTNKGDAFVTGERNSFIFKLASACCRFGISEQETCYLINSEFVHTDNSFQQTESDRTIKSAYRANGSKFGSAVFEKDVLIEKTTRSEVKIDPDLYNFDIKPKDVIFGEDVKDGALGIYDNGYESVEALGIPELDKKFKAKKGEISLLTGIGNYGKSSFLNWYLVCRVVKFGEKFAFFSPENNPAHEFYHDLVEILLGTSCTPENKFRPKKSEYEAAYDFVSKHIFYVYPKEIAPTPEYIKERFLELIIKEKVSGCIIDPFNQMSNDYNSSGGRTDKYLETFLSDCTRFAQLNSQYFIIVAHPKLMRKDTDGNYPCPDVFDIADGAMWNNKMDNILVYHRPNHQKDPSSPVCELHTKKVRRQKQVGEKGVIDFELYRPGRRFYFSGIDWLSRIITEKGLDFAPKQLELEEAPF